MRKRYLILAILAWFAVHSPSDADTGAGAGGEETRNLVKNGNFAAGQKHWRLGPFSTVEKVDGEGRLVINDTGREAGSDITGDAIPIKHPQFYRLSAKVKYEGDSTALIYVSSYKGTQLLRRPGIIGTGGLERGIWHTVSADLQLHPDADNIRLWIHSANGAIGRYVLKDVSFGPAPKTDVAEFFKTTRKGHPRLFLNEETLARVQQTIKSDPMARKASEAIVQYADMLLEAKPIAYVKVGNRMLQPAGQTLSRIKYLGMAHHLSGDPKYAEGGVAVLMAAATTPHWNTSHFLDTATLSFAAGLGYDWLYDHLDAAQRKTVVRAIQDKAILGSHSGTPWWLEAKSNWNQVCNGGLGIAALAVWEDVPELAARTIKRSVNGISGMLTTYAPDGIYFEGPSYWAYGTTYAVQFIDALETVMGTDFNLSEAPGFLESLDAINFITGPTNLFLNYSDGYRYRYAQAVSYWFARRRNDPNLLLQENRLLERALQKEPGSGHYPDLVMVLLWNDRAQAARPPERLYWHGNGTQPLASFRSSWDGDALFAAMKGGISGGGHQHMDAGSFVIDANGVRWASDAPSQSYSREENAARKAKAEGRPFERAFYRERWSHNILVVDGQKPVQRSVSPMVAFSDAPPNPCVIFDLGPAYEGQLAQAKRGMRFVGNQSVVVQDEFTTLDKANTHIRWAMLTLNSPELSQASVSPDGRRLVLRRPATSGAVDKQSPAMTMRILCPEKARFDVLVTNDQPYIHDYDRISDSARQVVIYLDVPANTERTLAVCFQPGGLKEEPPPGLAPLGQWTP